MPKFIRTFILFLFLLSIAQLAEYFVYSKNLDYYRNYNLLFGLVSLSSPVKSILIIDVLAVLVILNLFQHVPTEGKSRRVLQTFGWSLFLAGSVSNIFDRISRGYVVDYLDWKAILPYWPENFVRFFNLADLFIVAGLVLMGVRLVRSEQ